LFEDTPRLRGGQPGNQNARKHGYYSNALIGEDKVDLYQAWCVVGLDDEIALLRARLKAVVRTSPENIRLISQLASTLARLMRTNQKLGYQDASEFEKTRLKVLVDLGNSLGLDFKNIIDTYLGHPEPKT
jgi:hypothetical protein